MGGVAIQIIPDDTLQHHGILGQKWDKRNGPPYPLDSEDHSASEKKAGWKKSLDNSSDQTKYKTDVEGAKEKYKQAKVAQRKAYNKLNQATIANYDKAAKEYTQATNLKQLAKDDLSSEKVKTKLNNEQDISKHRQKLQEYYKNKGMNDEEAAVAAYKRARVEKAIAITAGLTIAAATVYIAKNQYDNKVDKILKSGTILKRIEIGDDQAVHDAFYASMSKSDSNKYKGLLGTQLNSRSRNNVYSKSISTVGNIKVASRKSATNVLQNLINNDSQFSSDLSKTINDYANTTGLGDKQKKLFKSAQASLAKGKIDSSVYDALNFTLVDYNASTTNKFYDAMRSAGYDAVSDMNDKKYSGFNAKTATIVFNKGKVQVDSVKKLSESEISNQYNIEQGKIVAKSLLKQVGATSAVIGAASAVGTYSRNKQKDKIVSEYKKEHPDTKLSYNEIVRNYYKE